MGRKKNTEAIVQFIILVGIAVLLLYAMLSKKVNYYVHPRFNLGIWGSIIILILFAIDVLSSIKKARHNVNIRHYILFAIPLAGTLFFPATGVSSTDMIVVNSNLSASSEEEQDEVNTNKEESADANTDTMDETNVATSNQAGNTSEKYAEYEVDGITVIDDDIFAEWYCDVYDNLDDFIGKRYQYLAQVYSMDDFKENQFLAGRNFMVCCAADLVGYGIICESDIRSDLNEEEWITVTGMITEYVYQGTSMPMLTNVTITKAEAPDIEYIFYNNY